MINRKDLGGCILRWEGREEIIDQVKDLHRV